MIGLNVYRDRENAVSTEAGQYGRVRILVNGGLPLIAWSGQFSRDVATWLTSLARHR